MATENVVSPRRESVHEFHALAHLRQVKYGRTVQSYVVTFTIVYLLATAFAIPTGGLMSLILPSLYYFILRAIELIGYYKTKGLSFYTDATTVINTVEFGYRSEQQLQSVEEYNQESEENDL